jgi:CubicO group peptidase (beta-lactamase class C family)
MQKLYKYGIKGHVDPEFDPVVRHLESFGAKGFEKQSQLCVYVGEKLVIDITMSPDPTFTPEHKTLVMSTGKGVASVLFSRMVDAGLVSYDDLVSKHWPEFAQNGKENIKICDVFRHESGLAKLESQLSMEDILTVNIKKNSIGSVIEKSKAYIMPNSPRIYHGFSRDWITGEIFRRVEPEGRTMGEYMRQVLKADFDFNFVLGA